jgi:micrococcal nuclease
VLTARLITCALSSVQPVPHDSVYRGRSSIRRPTPITVAVVLLATVVGVRAIQRRTTPQQTPDGTDLQQNAVVAYVIDGDTLELDDGRRVRLLGIDAPEMGFHDKQSDPFAAESTDWLRREVEGRAVTLRLGPRQTDRYGRTLAWVYDRDGGLLNQRCLEEGMARLLDKFGLPPELEPELRHAQEKARLAGRGLWARRGN